MNLISVSGLSHSESGRELFRNISFGIDDNHRIAIVGRNGSGKSTLLKLMAGYKEAENGTVARNRDLKIGYLEQTLSFRNGETIADFILHGDSEEIRLVKEYESLTSGLENKENSNLEGISRIMEEMDKRDCWSLENRIHSILTELGISDLTPPMESLSGGMVKKAAIARTLVTDANLIILDEPTNHLDIETINWLEKYLKSCGKALVIVTHDRYFMDSVCSRIFEIEDNELYTYDGNYSFYLSSRAVRDNSRIKENDRIKNILRNEEDWIKRGPRARGGKDRGRKARFFSLLEKKGEELPVTSSFSVIEKRLGGRILDLADICKCYGNKKPVDNFSFSFKKGDKVGIVGPNGSGKTTLLNLMAGKTAPDSGKVETGINTKIGFYDQHSADLPGSMKVADYIKETAQVITLNNGKSFSPSQFLEQFLFPVNLLYTEISNLSGGEKKKLYLLKILLENPNFLIFDEPTNDFDIQTLSVLENFLESFQGCTVIVSHDRFFLDRTVDFLFVLDGSGGVKGYSGDVTTYYSDNSRVPDGGSKSPRKKDSGRIVQREKKGLTFSEKTELAVIEDEIEELEKEKLSLEEIFVSSDNGADIKTAKIRYEKVLYLTEEKYLRWEDLESRKL